MATQENGLTANYSAPVAVNIASSTNANPIVVTTSSPHLMTNGDLADVNGHQVNTSANGIWVATVLTSTTFSIPVAGVGVGGATGTVQPLSAGTTFAIPSDGVDTEDAASVNVGFEALADRTAMLFATTGAWKFVNRYDASIGANPSDSGPSIVAATLSWGTVSALAGIGFGPGVNGVQVGDLVSIDFQAMASCSASISQLALSIWRQNYAPAATPPGYARLQSSMGLATSSGAIFAVKMNADTIATTAGELDFGIAAWASSGTPTVSFVGDLRIVMTVWRPTTVPQ